MAHRVTHGADVEALDDIALGLRRQGDRVGDVGSRGSMLLTRLRALWDGPDLEEFATEWRAAHREVDAAHDALRAYSRQLSLAAAGQRDVSGTGWGGGGAGGPGAGGGYDQPSSRVAGPDSAAAVNPFAVPLRLEAGMGEGGAPGTTGSVALAPDAGLRGDPAVGGVEPHAWLRLGR